MASIMLKMAVLAPIPTAIDAMAVIARAGLFNSDRSAYRVSKNSIHIGSPPPFTSVEPSRDYVSAAQSVDQNQQDYGRPAMPHDFRPYRYVLLFLAGKVGQQKRQTRVLAASALVDY
jgi:hypothetical protein